MGFRAQGFEGLYGLACVSPISHEHRRDHLLHSCHMPWQGCSGYHRGGEKAGCLPCTQGGHFLNWALVPGFWDISNEDVAPLKV